MNFTKNEGDFMLTATMFSSNRPSSPFTPVSKESVLSDLKASSQELDAGEGTDAKAAIQEMRRQHGFV